MEDIFTKRFPRLDLHGFDRDSACLWVSDFILENKILGNEYVVIIHGIGLGIVKKAVHDTLSKNKFVLEYKTDNFNDGMTIVRLKIDK